MIYWYQRMSVLNAMILCHDVDQTAGLAVHVWTVTIHVYVILSMSYPQRAMILVYCHASEVYL